MYTNNENTEKHIPQLLPVNYSMENAGGHSQSALEDTARPAVQRASGYEHIRLSPYHTFGVVGWSCCHCGWNNDGVILKTCFVCRHDPCLGCKAISVEIAAR